jgi:hypothetical protein
VYVLSSHSFGPLPAILTVQACIRSIMRSMKCGQLADPSQFRFYNAMQVDVVMSEGGESTEVEIDDDPGSSMPLNISGVPIIVPVSQVNRVAKSVYDSQKLYTPYIHIYGPYERIIFTVYTYTMHIRIRCIYVYNAYTYTMHIRIIRTSQPYR